MPLAYKDLKQPFIIRQVSKSVAYCKCGKSNNLPFCDDSHLTTNMQPAVLEFDAPRTIAICSCWKSNTHPYCDGTHGLLAVQPVDPGRRGGE